MWFLLSLNLSHWIGSFSTVGLDSHLGFRQKGLSEEKYFTFSFFFEKERAEGEWGHEFQDRAESDFQWARKPRPLIAGTSFKVKVQHIHCRHTFRDSSMSSIYCAQKSRWSMDSFIVGTFFEELYGAFIAAVQYGFRGQFGHSFQGKIRHRFRGRNLAHFPRQ